MSRRSFAFVCIFLALCCLGGVAAQDAAQPVFLRILLPDEKATLLIDNRPTKQTGTKRIFVTPPVAPGKTFTLTITAKWESKNDTEVVRSRVILAQAGKVIEVDLRKADDKLPDRILTRLDAPPAEVIEEMCKLAEVGKSDVVYDLGCGEGEIVVTAVADFKAKRGVGIDNDADLLKEAVAYAKEEKVADSVAFRKQDVLAVTDLGDASVVMLSQGEGLNLLLLPILKKTLRSGARIVSHNAAMGEWKADKTVSVTDEEKVKHTLYLWTIK